MDNEASVADLLQLFERDGRWATVPHGIESQLDFAVVTLIAPALDALGFSIATQFQRAEVVDDSDAAFAEDFKILLWNRPVAISGVDQICDRTINKT